MPFLPIRIINPDNGFDHKTWGLVDTGAIACSIPDYVATIIQHRVRDVPAEAGFGAGGDFPVYPHTCHIEILEVHPSGRVLDRVVHSITPHKVGVIERLPYVLLGVRDFLAEFKLFIDYPNRIFSVTR